jgi:hypothetical protein
LWAFLKEKNMYISREKNESLESLINRIRGDWYRQSPQAMAATSVGLCVEAYKIVGGQVVSNYNPLPHGWISTSWEEREDLLMEYIRIYRSARRKGLDLSMFKAKLVQLAIDAGVTWHHQLHDDSRASELLSGGRLCYWS